MTKYYIVVGSTGEYSDWTCWNVAAYPYKEQAEAHAAAANKACAGITGDWDKKKPNPYDPEMKCDYTGTKYKVQEIAVFPGFDAFQESVGL